MAKICYRKKNFWNSFGVLVVESVASVISTLALALEAFSFEEFSELIEAWLLQNLIYFSLLVFFDFIRSIISFPEFRKDEGQSRGGLIFLI